MGEGVCDIPHRIGDKVSSAIYVKTPLNQVDTFSNYESHFGFKTNNIYIVESGSFDFNIMMDKDANLKEI